MAKEGFYTDERHKTAPVNPNVKHRAPREAAATFPSFAAGKVSGQMQKQTVAVPIRTNEKPPKRGL